MSKDDGELRGLRKKLEAVRDLAEENHKLLKKIRRDLVIARIFKILYWALIIGLAVGAFYAIQPYLQPVFDLFQSVFPGLQGAESSTLLDRLQDGGNQ